VLSMVCCQLWFRAHDEQSDCSLLCCRILAFYGITDYSLKVYSLLVNFATASI
jgi:hypothetical protein